MFCSNSVATGEIWVLVVVGVVLVVVGSVVGCLMLLNHLRNYSPSCLVTCQQCARASGIRSPSVGCRLETIATAYRSQ